MRYSQNAKDRIYRDISKIKLSCSGIHQPEDIQDADQSVIF